MLKNAAGVESNQRRISPILTISQGIAVMTHIFVCVYHDVYGMTVTNRKH